MRLSLRPVPFAVLALGLAAGCGSDPAPPATVSVTQPPAPTTSPAPPGAAGVVAALDDSAAFSIRGDELVRLDAITLERVAAWPRPEGATSIAAVAPGGRWVALTDRPPDYDPAQSRATTELVVFDADSGTETRRLPLQGDVRPEAFSVDGSLVFALDHRGDHYRVQTITLATGERYDTTNRDKSLEREDMRGTTVRGVMNGTRTVLATLYRNPGDRDEPAFVHILDLVHGWAYCADLPPPFGTGSPGSDHIELTPADTVRVSTTESERTAEIHINEVLEPSVTPITVTFRGGSNDPSH